MYLLVEEFSNCFDYFLRLSGPSRFPDLFGKVVLITLNSPYLNLQQLFCKSNGSKTYLKIRHIFKSCKIFKT